jgi:hypothetical protein
MPTKRKPNHLAVARLSKHVTAQTLKECSQEINLPGNQGFDGPKETLQSASESVADANVEFAQECYPKVVGLCWQAMTFALQASREAWVIKAKEQWVRNELHQLERTVAGVEYKITAMDLLIVKTQKQYGEFSAATQFVEKGKPHVVQAVSSRRAAFTNAKRAVSKGEWDKAEQYILSANEAQRAANDLLNFVNRLIKDGFFKKVRIRKERPGSVRPAA